MVSADTLMTMFSKLADSYLKDKTTVGKFSLTALKK